jgi:hypothetical protein
MFYIIMDYDRKYKKYKQKYMQAKYNMQGGKAKITVDNAIAIIELWHKFLYAYYIYRARFDNTIALKNFTDLSNLMFQLSEHPAVKKHYEEMYLKDLESMIKKKDEEGLQRLMRDGKNKVIFTLRQDTTKLIRSLIFINQAAMADVNIYIDFLSSPIIPDENDYKELLEKCKQLQGLVTLGEFELSSEEMSGLDGIRYRTNLLLKQLGDTYASTIENMTEMRPNNLDDKVNRALDRTINSCLRDIKIYIDSELYDFDGLN